MLTPDPVLPTVSVAEPHAVGGEIAVQCHQFSQMDCPGTGYEASGIPGITSLWELGACQ